MAEILDKVSSIPTICGIDFAFNGNLLPSVIDGWQRFNNAIEMETDFKPTHFGRASVVFAEENDESNAGISYKQKVSIRFPSTDLNRATRLQLLQKVKFVKLKLSNGLNLIIGRNDFEQNAKPVIDIKTDERLAQFDFSTVSIFASGYTPSAETTGLPTFIPIDLISTE